MKNWTPTAHSIGISLTLIEFIHLFGIGPVVDFGQFVFGEVIRHVASEAIKLPITYRSLLFGMILKQYSDVLRMRSQIHLKSLPRRSH